MQQKRKSNINIWTVLVFDLKHSVLNINIWYDVIESFNFNLKRGIYSKFEASRLISDYIADLVYNIAGPQSSMLFIWRSLICYVVSSICQWMHTQFFQKAGLRVKNYVSSLLLFATLQFTLIGWSLLWLLSVNAYIYSNQDWAKWFFLVYLDT